MIRVHCRGQKLRPKHVCMGLHRKLPDLRVEMGDRGSRVATGDHP